MGASPRAVAITSLQIQYKGCSYHRHPQVQETRALTDWGWRQKMSLLSPTPRTSVWHRLKNIALNFTIHNQIIHSLTIYSELSKRRTH